MPGRANCRRPGPRGTAQNHSGGKCRAHRRDPASPRDPTWRARTFSCATCPRRATRSRSRCGARAYRHLGLADPLQVLALVARAEPVVVRARLFGLGPRARRGSRESPSACGRRCAPSNRGATRSVRAVRARCGRDPLRNDADASTRFVASRRTGAFQLRRGREHAVVREQVRSRPGHARGESPRAADGRACAPAIGARVRPDTTDRREVGHFLRRVVRAVAR